MPTIGNAEVSSRRASNSVPGRQIGARLGRRPRAPPAARAAMSVPQPKTRSSCAPPRVVIERMVSTPGTLVMAFSSGWVSEVQGLLDRQVAGAGDQR